MGAKAVSEESARNARSPLEREGKDSGTTTYREKKNSRGKGRGGGPNSSIAMTKRDFSRGSRGGGKFKLQIMPTF